MLRAAIGVCGRNILRRVALRIEGEYTSDMADHSAMEMTIGIGAYLPQRWKTRAFEGCENA
jgi:hypothetical protein